MKIITIEQIKDKIQLQLPLNLLRVLYSNKYKSIIINRDTGRKRRAEMLYTNKYGLTQFFGSRPSVYKPYKGHTGLDFFTVIPTPVYAMIEGVITTGFDKYGGNYIKISNSMLLEDINADIEVVYYHLKSFIALDGQYVRAGDKVAISGNSGIMTSGPHLHGELAILQPYGQKMVRQSNGYHGCLDYLSMLNYPEVDGDLLTRFDGKYVQRTDKKNGGHGEVYLIDGYTAEHITFDPPKAFSNALRKLSKIGMLTGINEENWNKIKDALI